MLLREASTYAARIDSGTVKRSALLGIIGPQEAPRDTINTIRAYMLGKRNTPTCAEE
jgi:hypothetical protein